MNVKSAKILFFVSSLAVLVAGLVLKSSTELDLCLVSEPSCIGLLTEIGNGLFYGGTALSIVFLILFFVPKAFSAWKKFAIWFVPLAVLVFIFYPEPGSGDFLTPYKETVFQWVSGAYVLLSAGIIALSLSKKNPK